MKKTLFLAIMAGAALAGCVKNEEVAKGSGGSPERITFEAPVVSVPTRATEIYGNYPGGADFAVYARYHESPFAADATASSVNAFTDANSAYYMSDVRCVADNTTTPTTWKPTTTYYWPKNGYLTFAAYAPARIENVNTGENQVWNDATVDWDDKGFEFTNFEVLDEPTQQIDLLYSERVYDKKRGNEATDKPYDGITIPFKHALSSIVFKVRAAGNYASTTEIKLTGITINKVVNEGTFTQNLIADKTGDSNTPTWTFLDENKDNKPDATVIKDSYKVFPKKDATDDEKTVLVNSTTAVFVNGDPDATDGNTANEEYDNQFGDTDGNKYPNDPSKVNDGKRRSDLLVIPQELIRGEDKEHATDADKVTVTISYTIKNGSADPLPQTHTFQMVAETSGDKQYVWEMGKRYVYTITIGLYEIYFNPQVLNWEDVNSSLTEI